MKPLAMLVLAGLAGCATEVIDLTEPPGPEMPGGDTGDTGGTDTTSAATGRCYARDGMAGRLVELDLAAETARTLNVSIPTSDLSSLGLADGHLVWCRGDGVAFLDLATHLADWIDGIPCVGATGDGHRIFVQSSDLQHLIEFDGLAALRANRSARTLPAPFATRLGIGRGRLVASWHSAAEVLDVDLADGRVSPLPLAGYDGWIYGIAELGDALYVNGGWVEKGIRAYDRTTGAPLATLFADRFLAGLACDGSTDACGGAPCHARD